MEREERLLTLLDRFEIDARAFAELAGITYDDVHAISEGSARAPHWRVAAICALMKSAGVHKSRSVFRRHAAPARADLDWKPIPGFPAYEASRGGDIRRIKASNVGLRVLRQMPNGRGYLKVTLYDEFGKKISVPVHRAVCLAWHGLPSPERNFACHRNGIPTQNGEANLYWGTSVENAQDVLRHGRHTSQNRGQLVQTPYKRTTPRKIRIAFEEGIISYKQYLDEIDALNSKA